MSDKKYKYIELRVPDPGFGSELTSMVLQLETLRSLRLGGTTYIHLFFELKQLFHFLESVGSARIEGNRTTISQYIESQLEDRPYINEDIEEIRNIERAMRWIDELANENALVINRAFVSDLHKMIVQELTPPPDGEGAHRPGKYRDRQVEIQGSKHMPPPPYVVDDLMNELFEFIYDGRPSQYDLLKIALAHHRFMWIHPFGNGNGRTGRLVTYAMLVNAGFKVHVGQILNPTAIFCIDRDKYNELLSNADQGTDKGLVDWCLYVLSGLNEEITKITRLTDERYVRDALLVPALNYSLKMKYIDAEEFKILKLATERSVIQAKDVKKIFKQLHPVTISRKLGSLREKDMLKPEKEGGNKYYISFINNFLVRGMIQALEQEGYVPLND